MAKPSWRSVLQSFFSSAAYAHLALLRKGVAPRNIGKLFAIGELRALGLYWEFHVATIVRDSEGRWWAIDPLAGSVLDARDWMRKIESFDRDPRHPTLRFYFSDAVKFQPFYGTYSAKNLHLPVFGRFFDDLADSVH